MFDVNSAQKQAEQEIAEEAAKEAKTKIKAHLKKMAAARQVIVNLEREYAALLAEIGEDGAS